MKRERASVELPETGDAGGTSSAARGDARGIAMTGANASSKSEKTRGARARDVAADGRECRGRRGVPPSLLASAPSRRPAREGGNRSDREPPSDRPAAASRRFSWNHVPGGARAVRTARRRSLTRAGFVHTPDASSWDSRCATRRPVHRPRVGTRRGRVLSRRCRKPLLTCPSFFPPLVLPPSQVAVIYYSRNRRLVTLANVIAEGVRQVRPRNVHTRLDRIDARRTSSLRGCSIRPARVFSRSLSSPPAPRRALD
jgi:hypothetical protein